MSSGFTRADAIKQQHGKIRQPTGVITNDSYQSSVR